MEVNQQKEKGKKNPNGDEVADSSSKKRTMVV
jgi:hypothetical protein